MYKGYQERLNQHYQNFIRKNSELYDRLSMLDNVISYIKEIGIGEYSYIDKEIMAMPACAELESFIYNDNDITCTEKITNEKALDILKDYIYYNRKTFGKYISEEAYVDFGYLPFSDKAEWLVDLLVDVNRHHELNKAKIKQPLKRLLKY